MTRDIGGSRGRNGIRGKALQFLRLVVDRGYILSKEVKTMRHCMRTLKKYLPVRRVEMFNNSAVWFLPGREREAMEALLKACNKKSINYSELGRIRRAFGIKSLKRDNKTRERLLQ
jgi:hypothetical protein